MEFLDQVPYLPHFCEKFTQGKKHKQKISKYNYNKEKSFK
jgi:hypothetical protein